MSDIYFFSQIKFLKVTTMLGAIEWRLNWELFFRLSFVFTLLIAKNVSMLCLFGYLFLFSQL